MSWNTSLSLGVQLVAVEMVGIFGALMHEHARSRRLSALILQLAVNDWPDSFSGAPR